MLNHSRPHPRHARWPILATLLIPLWAQAADLYQASVPVAGTGVEERNQAIGRALEAVLVKLTGRRNSAGSEAARALGREAPNLVQQYRYEALPGGADTPQAPDRLLQVRFDGASLRQALKQEGLPVWGGTRPSLLLWIGLEMRGNRRFLLAEADPGLLETARRVSDERGLSFLFPLMDMEDFARLTPSDLWGGFGERVREASGRYSADLVLVGKLQQTAGGWQVGWQLLNPQGSEDWQTRAETAELAAESGLQEAVDRIAERYAPAVLIDGGDQPQVLVRGVHGLPALKSVEQQFASLDAVQSVTLTRVEPDRIWLRLTLAGGRDAVARGATLGGLLTQVPAERQLPAVTPGAAVPPFPDLVFELQP